MAQVSKPVPVRLFIGVVSAFDQVFPSVKRSFEDRFGTCDCHAGPFNFSSFTSHYEPEMGKDLKRFFYSFQKLVESDDIADIKIWTNKLEMTYTSGEYPVARPVNIDPGYLTLDKITLASAKNNSQRIHLSSGIYAEITLKFSRQHNSYMPLDYTYPDYKTSEYIGFFNSLRQIYNEQLKKNNFEVVSFKHA